MTAVTTNETVLTCEGCGDEVATLTEGRGPCCHNLPRPWVRSAEGLYNSTDEYDHEADEDEDEDEDSTAPHCTQCGSTDFRIFAEQVTTASEEYENVPVEASEFEVERITCSDCGTRYQGEWEWA